MQQGQQRELELLVMVLCMKEVQCSCCSLSIQASAWGRLAGVLVEAK
jgi:hypothetical protein